MKTMRDNRGRFAGKNGHAQHHRFGEVIPQEPQRSKSKPMRVSELVRGMFQSASGILIEADLALRENRALQRQMRRDPDVMAPLLQRLYAVALLDWDIIPEDEDDETQVEQANTLKRLIGQNMRRQTAFLAQLSDAVWFGRGAAHVVYRRVTMDGTEYVAPTLWTPYHADSIAYMDDGSPGVMVSHKFPGTKVPGFRGHVHLFDDVERRSTVIHVHQLEAPDFDEYKESMFYYGGRGLRDMIYWAWMMKQTGQQHWMTMVERYSMGIRKVYYEQGNDEARDEMKLGADNLGRDMSITIPRVAGEDPINDIEIQDVVSTGGFEVVARLVENYLAGQIKEMIIGQTATTEATNTGLGSDVGTRHAETKQQIIKRDAMGLADTLTHEFVSELNVMNFGNTAWRPKWEFAVEHVDAEQYLQAVEKAVGMGLSVSQRSVRQALGYDEPKEGEPLMESAQQQMPGEFGQGFEDGFEFARSDEYGRAVVSKS